MRRNVFLFCLALVFCCCDDPYEVTRTSDNGSTQVVLLFDYE